MTLRLRPERFLLGLHGLTLLRGWPYGDPRDSAATVEAIREVLRRVDRGELEDVVVGDLNLDDAYTVWSATYDSLPNALITAEEPVLRALLRAEPPGLALDVAAGTGRLTALLRDLGHDVVALDRSAAMLASAEEAVAKIRADLRGLPIRDRSVELVVCGLALTHVRDLGPAIAELARVVRPGGAVVLTDVHPVSVATGGQAMFRREDGSRAVTRNHLHWMGGYVNAAVAAGLVVERCEEVLVDEAFLEEMRDVGLRSAATPALLGLPVALLWRLRKPR
jgi:ubiquinone/menaquinone biosynthesis C-methylase UbiE